ncbi:sodium-coupled monocarboxylate transporter 1-like [Narcine bancroftii]|uniref:sodium-coupled monocarboxylate transporter 1-like n=1 Tax=Narcine bancroftii TaxID=1343680 RepID=UPI0038312F79
MIGGPVEVYLFGIMVVLFTISCLFTIIYTGLIYIPLFYRLNIISSYEYINRRFGSAVKYQIISSFLMYMCIYLGIATYAPALALNEVTGINLWVSIMTTGFVCTLYTALGGIKAVVWTDVFQICIMVAGLLALMIQGLMRVGGFGKVWRIAEQGGRINLFDFDPDPRRRHTFWTTVVGGTFAWTAIYSCNQAQIQRYLACRSEKEAQKAIFLNWVGMLVVTITACMCGLVMYAVYENCDPLGENRITNANQMAPLLVLDILSQVPGVPGLFIASAFSGTLSTISSGINAISAIFVEDIIKPNCKSWKHISAYKQTLFSKLLAVMFGLMIMGLAGLTSLFEENVMQLSRSVDGLILGPVLGVFTLAALFPKCNSKGAFVGILAGFSFSVFMLVCSQVYPAVDKFTRRLKTSTVGCLSSNVTTSSRINGTSLITTIVRSPTPDKIESMVENVCFLSYGYYTPVGCLLTVITALVISAVTGGTKDVDPTLIAPIIHIIHRILFKKKPAAPLPEASTELLETTPEKIFSPDHHSSGSQKQKPFCPLISE